MDPTPGAPIPASIKLISVATGIRWIGWGMAEPLLPVFIFSLVGNYGVSGLAESVGQIIFLLGLPVAGILADRIPLKTFLLWGLAFFFFDGLYAIAALTGMIALVFISSAFDGVAVASDVVGRATYLRRYSPPERIGSVMGFQNTVTNFGMIVGAVISLVLVPFVSFAWIFFGIIPANLAAFILFSMYLPSEPAVRDEKARTHPLAQYWGVWREALQWQNGLRPLAGLMFLFNMLGSFAAVLIPIYAFIRGATLQEIIILGIIVMLPEMFSAPLGRAADRWRHKLLPAGLILSALLIASLTLAQSYLVLLGLVLGLKTMLVLLGLVVENLITARADPAHYGRVSAVVEGLKDIGKFAGATGLGFAIDFLGSSSLFAVLAVAIFGVGLLSLYAKKLM